MMAESAGNEYFRMRQAYGIGEINIGATLCWPLLFGYNGTPGLLY